ncbi:hypothetical protein BH09VER1_BH09VER1_17810 [soil metagenome]
MKNTSNQQNSRDANNGLVRAWLAFAATPQSKHCLNQIGRELDRAIRESLPAGTFRDVLRGREQEFWQDANILLLQRFLVGNPRLTKATREVDTNEIANQLYRSISASLKISIARRRRIGRMEERRFREITDADIGLCYHPACRQFWALPSAVQFEITRIALQHAVASNLLSSASVKVARLMLAKNFNQSKAAREIGISRQAINQRLKPVGRFLNAYITHLEFPMA